MRFRVILILALFCGVIGLLLLSTRKPHRAVETATGSVTNSSSLNRASFKKAAPAASLDPADSVELSPPDTSTNWLRRLFEGELDFQLTPEQQAEYLRQYGTNIETLLATQNTNYIRLAAQLFPNDPRVQCAVLARDLFPEARREWLDRFKQSAPGNAVADYLSARDYLKAGDRENAMKDLANASGKSRFNDYTLEQVQNMEDAQLTAGRSLVEAKAAAGTGILLPQLGTFKGLAQDLQKMQKEYLGAGDTASAEALAQMGHALSQQLSAGDSSRTLISQLVGMAIDRIVLNSLPPDSQPAFLDGTVQQRLDELTEWRKNARPLLADFQQMLGRASEVDVIGYFDRMKLQGEWPAMLWLQNRDKLH